jgi:uncharacterized OB-fold protein
VSGPPPPSAGKYIEREMDDVAREFYRRWRHDGRLMTTRCDRCDATGFPPRSRCARCGSNERWVPLPDQGRLYAFTTQEQALRFHPPWVLALADFGGAIVPGVVQEPYESLGVGQPVTAVAHDEPDTGLTLVRFESV